MTSRDRMIIRDLAERVAEAAARPEMEERRRLWYAQNSLDAPRPLVFVSPEGAWLELLPPGTMMCEDDDARAIENGLRQRLYAADHFADDQVCDAVFRVQPAVHQTGWGIGPRHIHSGAERGAYNWEPPINTLDDIEKIQTPTYRYDPGATERYLAFATELLDGIMEVRLHGTYWWALGLIDEWTMLRGITNTFWDMVDQPEMVHRGMERLMEGRLAGLESLEQQGLLYLNNGNQYVGSGGFGFTDELPSEGYDGRVRLIDMWGFCEAQTMSEVSPAMHEEFVLRYQLAILDRFGLNCYGCCEPLHDKLDMLLARVPRMRRVSISPWADKRISAEKIQDRCVYSWKPSPAPLAAITFDPEAVRSDVRETVAIAREHGCTLEIILKDTHTCNHEPERFDLWSRVAMEEAMAGAGVS
ncbi:MAG: hypothetical protein GF320_05160 [Armatimonadia bacterium]|nr:hypothetical protein [Armatimonadia bacterium]